MKAAKENTNRPASRTAHNGLGVPAPAAQHELSRSLGNRALAHFLHVSRPNRLQPKLAVSHPYDPLEQQADRVADAVLRMPQSAFGIARTPTPRVQRLCPGCEEDLKRRPLEEEEPIQTQPLPLGTALRRQAPPEEEEPLQAKTDLTNIPEVNPEVETAIQSLPGRGQPLPDAIRSFMEPRFNTDFSAVRLHTDPQAHDLARSVNAQAFTVGSHVVFGAGHYAPETERGRHLLAHELTHVVQQGAAPANERVQRACGSSAIGTPTCDDGPLPPVFEPGPFFKFVMSCDDFERGEERGLLTLAASFRSGDSVEIHGYASVDGSRAFNERLACARALKARTVLAAAGITVSRTVFHRPTPGPAADRRSVVIKIARAPEVRLLRFRAAAWSFLSCAPCNPFTDDGSLGVSPPTSEPSISTTHRQVHFIEAELGTTDGRTIAPGTARLGGSGNDVGISHFCGAGHRAHIVGSIPPAGGTPVRSPAGIEGIELASELTSRVGSVVPATLPGAPCGFLGTNPLIPVIGNRFRMRLFADGTKESEFVSATLYPSHFIYEDGALKLFGGTPVHPRQDFFAWATSTVPSLTVAATGFKALRLECCTPGSVSGTCATTCTGGFSVPTSVTALPGCAALGAAITAMSCPAPCAPAGGSCPPLVGPSNPP